MTEFTVSEARVLLQNPFMSFADERRDAIARKFVTRFEDDIAARMHGKRLRRATVQVPSNAKKPDCTDLVRAGTIAARVLNFLAEVGTGRSGDETPHREGLTSAQWRSVFTHLRRRGFIDSEGDVYLGLDWSLTDKGRRVVESGATRHHGNYHFVNDGSIGSGVLKHLRDHGLAFSGDASPYRNGASDKAWLDAFSNLKRRGFIRTVGECRVGKPALWTLTDSGRDMVAKYGDQA